MNGKNKTYTRIAFIVLPLLLGTGIYLKGRKHPVLFETWFYQNKETSSLPGSGWIPDYLWCVSLWTCFVWIWKGWNQVPMMWKWGLWLLVMFTEPLQWIGWLQGTGDWIDLLMYQLAFFTVYTLHKSELI
ncbi:hypothetical protein [Sediminibacterium goheungense]|uniref:hypothetical protein n=1 Tax=Sediminibacterium goheungense TaxID=1086393 RepID=UPI00105EB8F4|nr:hypothetical protein [Sediminibacterium goheungense]